MKCKWVNWSWNGNVSGWLTISGHAQGETLLQSAVLASVAIDFVHDAVLLSGALVIDHRRLGAPEESFAALARDDPIMNTGTLVTAHLARDDLNLRCNHIHNKQTKKEHKKKSMNYIQSKPNTHINFHQFPLCFLFFFQINNHEMLGVDLLMGWWNELWTWANQSNRWLSFLDSTSSIMCERNVTSHFHSISEEVAATNNRWKTQKTANTPTTI